LLGALAPSVERPSPSMHFAKSSFVAPRTNQDTRFVNPVELNQDLGYQ